MKKGFTLIELLVVVLIIGILSAVALPQYEKAVEKARAAEGIALTRAIMEAQQRYYLANNTYTTDLKDLDIEIPGSDGGPTGNALTTKKTKYFTCAAASLGTAPSIIAFCNRNDTYGYYIYVNNGSPVLRCSSWTWKESGEKVCKMLTGKTEGTSMPF